MTHGKGVSFDRSGFGSIGEFLCCSDAALMPERKTCSLFALACWLLISEICERSCVECTFFLFAFSKNHSFWFFFTTSAHSYARVHFVTH